MENRIGARGDVTPLLVIPHDRKCEAISARTGKPCQRWATHFASEIAAVTEDGGDLLRQRVAALDEGQRQLLREALDEVKVDHRLTSLRSPCAHA